VSAGKFVDAHLSFFLRRSLVEQGIRLLPFDRGENSFDPTSRPVRRHGDTLVPFFGPASARRREHDPDRAHELQVEIDKATVQREEIRR
jgi:hypothetical protein